MKELPREYSDRMKKILGNDYEEYINSLNDSPVRAFRVNTNKITLEDFKKINIFSKEKIPYVENGFYLDYDKIGNHPYHHAGMIYVQEPAAMAPVECVDIEPDWKVLDMCAAPGGKSTQLKNKLGENGILVSNEIIPSRCKILTGNIERLGLNNCVVTCMNTAKLAKTFPKAFNLVMCDAPCSGEGMFRKEEAAINEWSNENVIMCSERQSEILDNAAKLVTNGGYIIYATCTFSVEENEMTVDNFLKNHPEFELVPVNKRIIKHTVDGIEFEGCECKDIKFTRRFYPHVSKGEGQFMAVLHNTLDTFSESKHIKKSDGKIDRIVEEFLNDTLSEYNKSHVLSYNGNPVYFSPDFEIPKGAAFCCGITIGEIKKNYILPHHQFFMAMGKYFNRIINLSAESDEIKKFLHGEEFETDCINGWAVVMVDGCSVGGVKVVNGRAKNHYPKGLRTK
ncbi:MAG: methyltransferase domain-containing protein [Clostridia bacterium]|nr:methyltransferase domain-containing protein [Clostridia bacterium]